MDLTSFCKSFRQTLELGGTGDRISAKLGELELSEVRVLRGPDARAVAVQPVAVWALWCGGQAYAVWLVAHGGKKAIFFSWATKESSILPVFHDARRIITILWSRWKSVWRIW